MKRISDRLDIHSPRGLILFAAWIVAFLAACWLAYRLS
jgi:hypothetical protein